MIGKWLDSYHHYRSKVGLGRVHAAVRAAYYETLGREPQSANWNNEAWQRWHRGYRK